MLHLTFFSNAQCTLNAPTGTPGFTPHFNNFPCFTNGTYIDETIHFENFRETISVGDTNYALRFDTVSNLPNGVSWEMSVPVGNLPNVLYQGESGCIRLFGLMNDTIGLRKIEFRLSLFIGQLSYPAFNKEIDCNMSYIIGIRNGEYPNPNTNYFEYYTRIIDAGNPCFVILRDSCSNGYDFPIINLNTSDFNICIGDSAELYPNVTGGVPPYQYHWSPAQGLTDTTSESPIVFPPLTTTYSLTVTDQNGYTDSASITIYARNLDSTISVYAKESNGNDLPNTKVYLIEYNADSSSVAAVDSGYTDQIGFIQFNYSDEYLFVKVVPDSLNYPDEMPTYHYGISFPYPFMFFPLDEINTTNCDSNSITVYTMYGNNPGGSGFISGNIFQGAGKNSQQGLPAKGLYTFLVNSSDKPVTYSITDEAGYFAFNNIANGNYRIFIDVPDFNTNLAPQISINNAEPVQDSLVYYLENHTTLVEGFNKNKSSSKIYPHPITKHSVIVFSESFHDIQFQVYDIAGKLLLNEKYNETEKILLDRKNLSNGVFFYSITADKNIIKGKIVVQ